jgi:hypothetical protein
MESALDMNISCNHVRTLYICSAAQGHAFSTLVLSTLVDMQVVHIDEYAVFAFICRFAAAYR